MVEVVVREEKQLDVLDGCNRVAASRPRGLASAALVRRPGVDERQRLAFQQPQVDRAEVRHRERD